MSIARTLTLLAALCLVGPLAPALSDTVHLKDGTTVNGRIAIRTESEIRIKTEDGEWQKIQMEDIERIEESAVEEEAAPAEEEAAGPPPTEFERTDNPDPLISEQLEQAQRRLKELNDEISDLEQVLERVDPDPNQALKYESRRLELGKLMAERAATQYTIDTLEVLQRWREEPQAHQLALARRITQAALPVRDQDLTRIVDHEAPDAQRPTAIWQPAFLSVVPTPLWASSAGRKGEEDAREAQAERDRRSDNDRGAPPGMYGGRSSGGHRGGGGSAESEVRISGHVRYVEGTHYRSKRRLSQRMFRSTLEEVQTQTTAVLRVPLAILEASSELDAEMRGLLTDYRDAWQEYAPVARRSDRNRGAEQPDDAERRRAMEEALQQRFAQICRAAGESGAVLPLVALMMIENSAEDVPEAARASWGTDEHGQYTRNQQRVVANYLRAPAVAEGADGEATPADPGAPPGVTEKPEEEEMPAFDPSSGPPPEMYRRD